MSFRQKKLVKLLKLTIDETLSNTNNQTLTYEELFVVLYEANIKLSNEAQEEKLRQIFLEGPLNVRDIHELFVPIQCHILHNKQVFHVRIREHHFGHSEKKCFDQWKKYMEIRFGNQLRWFDGLAGEFQCRRMKSLLFKESLRLVLQNTTHEGCQETIYRKFPKNKKNEVQWSTFMAVLRHNPLKYDRNTSSLRKSEPSLMKEEKWVSLRKKSSRMATQKSKEKTLTVWSQCSLENVTSASFRDKPRTPKLSFLSKKQINNKKQKLLSKATTYWKKKDEKIFRGKNMKVSMMLKKQRIPSELIREKSQIFLL